jgi:sugar lactone lactonase YvrE
MKDETMSTVECVANRRDVLGEVPMWCPKSELLWWIDVRRPCLQSYNPATGEHRIMPTPGRDVGSFAFRRSGGMVVGLNDGLYSFDPQTGAYERLVELEPTLPGNRLNDAKCDRHGRFWVGTQQDGSKVGMGSFYRIDPDHRFEKFFDGIFIANGVAISPDDKSLYFADTRLNLMWVFDFDIDAGVIINRQVFCDTSSHPGRPDGTTVDAEGFLWNAEVFGSRLVRYAPDGRIDRVVPLPVSLPTSCAFGGRNLDVLYITTSTQGMTPRRFAEEPMSGGLLALDVGVRGLPEPTYAG